MRVARGIQTDALAPVVDRLVVQLQLEIGEGQVVVELGVTLWERQGLSEGFDRGFIVLELVERDAVVEETFKGFLRRFF